MGGLGLVWLTMQLWLFYSGGIRPAGDTGRYLSAAEFILSGHLPTNGKAMSYLAYDSFVAIFLGLGLGQEGIIFAQVLISGFAACALFLLGSHLYDWRAGLIAALLYAGFPDLQKWNFYILTESLFISAIILTTYIIMVYRGWKRVIFGGLLLLFVALLRPNGFIVPFALVLFFILQLWLDGKRKLVTGILVSAISILSLVSVWVGDMLSKEHVLEHYINGTVIWGHPESALTMPGETPDCAHANGNPLLEILCFTLAKPLFFLELLGMKLFYFFLLARPYYSASHNFIILLVLLPVYALTILCWYHRRKDLSRWAYPAIIIFLQSVVVAFTFADWDSRHLQMVLPLFFVFAAIGTVYLVDRYREKSPVV